MSIAPISMLPAQVLSLQCLKALIHTQGATPQDGVCLLVIDKSALTKDIKSIEAAAKGHGVSAEWLVNADRAGETGNPWLRWNEAFPGDVILLPGGQVDGEGWFALPPNCPGPCRPLSTAR